MSLAFIRYRLEILRLKYSIEDDSVERRILSRMIDEYEAQEEWLRQVHHLAIDHVDGNLTNNKPENLRLVRITE